MPSARLFAAFLLLAGVGHAQPLPSAPDTGDRLAVAYVETTADGAAAGRAALGQYRDAVRRQAGCLGVELFEQVGRPGRFAVLELWGDAAGFEARNAEPKRKLLEALRPIRVSGYDERPYQALSPDGRDRGPAQQTGVFVISHVDVAPNTQAPELLRELAGRSRGEPGNLRFAVFQHVQRGNHFTVVEHWRNEAALEQHVSAAHTREYRDALQPLTGSPLDERLYTPFD
jgi:quinol monooxygenase YgiN